MPLALYCILPRFPEEREMPPERVRLDVSALDRKLTRVAWVIFLAMWGATLLVEVFAHVDLRSLQYLCAGLILLGLNGMRYVRGIPMSRLTLVIGMLAVAGGVLRQSTGEVSLMPAVLTTVGSVAVVELILRLQGGGRAKRSGPGRKGSR